MLHIHEDLSLNREYASGHFIVRHQARPNSRRLSQKKTIHALMKCPQSSPLISLITASPPLSIQNTQAVIY